MEFEWKEFKTQGPIFEDDVFTITDEHGDVIHIEVVGFTQNIIRDHWRHGVQLKLKIRTVKKNG